MSKTVSLQIDGKKIIADHGVTILEAARQNGINIPTLCFHPRLEPLGHCRICLVEVQGLERPVTACDNPITDGMVVTTSTPELETMRSATLEMALGTHPYKDCLTCVRTGTCELQDNAYVYQVSLPDQLDRDVPAEKDSSSSYIVRDEEKCILCGRCIQICRTGPGCFVYEMIGKGVNTRVVPYRDGREVSMEEAGCIFCGQCVDVCPVAALTENGREEGGREWELDTYPGFCIDCSLGCFLERKVYDDKLIRVTVPAEGDKAGWLCRKGKFGYFEHEATQQVPEDIIEKAAEAIKNVKDKHGPEKIAITAAGQLSIEENYLLQKMARELLGTVNLDLGAEEAWIKAYTGMLEQTGLELEGPNPAALAAAGCIIVLGSGLSESHPVADMAIKRAGRFGDAAIIRSGKREENDTSWNEINFNLASGEETVLVDSLLKIMRGEDQEQVARDSGLEQVKLLKTKELIKMPDCYMVVCPDYFALADSEKIAKLLEFAQEGNLSGKGYSKMMLLSAFSNAAGSLVAGGTPYHGPGLNTLNGKKAVNRVGLAEAVEQGEIKALLSFGAPPEEVNTDQLECLVLVSDNNENAAPQNGFKFAGQPIESKEGLFADYMGRIRLNQAALGPEDSNTEDWRLIVDFAIKMGAKWQYQTLEDVREELEDLIAE